MRNDNASPRGLNRSVSRRSRALVGVLILAVVGALVPQVSAAQSPRKAHRKPGHATKHTTTNVSARHHGKRQAQHARTGRTKHRKPKQVARRPLDPNKMAFPELAEGDGSPVLDIAARYIGRPYRFGANGSTGAFDCSGFVRQVFLNVGIALPHSAKAQFAYGDDVARDELEPGDLVFFRTYHRHPSHVGIYVGEDKFVHATSNGGWVQVDSLGAEYYARRFLGARRLDS